MIYNLSPSDISLIKELISEGICLKECAYKFDICESTLKKNLEEESELGYKAYAFPMLKDLVQPICKDKKLWECYHALKAAGLYFGTKKEFRSKLCYARIDYVKVSGAKTTTYRNTGGLSKIARDNNINPSTLFTRLENGQTLEEALGQPVYLGYKYKYNGIIGIPKISEHYQVSRSALHSRIKKGMTIGDAIADIKRKNCHDRV